MDKYKYTGSLQFVTVSKLTTLEPQRRPMATKTPLIVLKAKHLARRMQATKLSSVGAK